MPAQQFIENGDGSQSRRGDQHRDDFAIPDASQRIEPPPLARHLLLRGESGGFFEPVSGGGAKPGFRGGNGRRMASTEGHVELCKHTEPANFVCVAQGFDRGGFGLFFHARNRDRFSPVLKPQETLEHQCLKLHHTPHFTH